MKKLLSRVFVFSGGLFTFFLIILFFFSLSFFIQNSYSSLHNYEFVINIKTDLIEKKKVELIDILYSNIEDSIQESNINEGELFYFKKNSIQYENFSLQVSNLSEEKFYNLFRDLWFAFELPNDFDGLLMSCFDKNNKIKFIADLYSQINEKENKMLLHFDEDSSSLFRKTNIKNEKTKVELLFEQYKKHKFIYHKNLYNPQDPSLDLSFFIDKKFNFNFFTHKDDETYSILPSIISILLTGVFIIITILTLAIFTAIYLDLFIDNESYKITKIFKSLFLIILEFYQFLPEILLAIISFSFFIYTLNIENNSILFFGINLFLIIFPILVNIVLRSLKLLTQNLKESLKMAESKVKFIITDLLPIISPYVIFHAIKTLSYVTNFGLLFFITQNFDYSKITPSDFSDDLSSIAKDIFITGFSSNQDLHLISPMILCLICMNIFLYSLALFVKRFVSINFY